MKEVILKNVVCLFDEEHLDAFDRHVEIAKMNGLDKTHPEYPKLPPPDVMSYRKYLMKFLRAPLNPQAGVDGEEMANAMPIFQKLRALHDNAEKILLEDAEYEVVVQHMKAYRATRGSWELHELMNSVKAARDVTVGVTDDSVDES